MRRLILWIVDEQHLSEQRVSEASVAHHMPDVDRRCFVTVRSTTWYDLYIRTLIHSLGLKDADNEFYEQILFLDSDTYLCEAVYDLFDILEKYDVVSTHAPARQTTDMPEEVKIPEAYCECNTGVFGYVNTSAVGQLFDLWLERYYAMFLVSGDNDQSALRAAMWEQGTRVYIMPNEYNFRAGFGGFAAGAVKILHLRSKDMSKAEHMVNEEHVMRTFQRGTIQ